MLRHQGPTPIPNVVLGNRLEMVLTVVAGVAVVTPLIVMQAPVTHSLSEGVFFPTDTEVAFKKEKKW